VSWLSDAALDHLCKVADWPDLGGTRYEAVEKIGQGGMGAVFLVKDRDLDRFVALKVMRTRPDDAAGKARMMAEARLEHPGIVPIHDAGVLPDGRFYYAMKFVHGKRLDEHVTPAMALPERLQLFQKICDTVGFAHARGIVHRDLKPQNVMVGPFGEVLVLDWGVACEIETKTDGVAVGTPGYMPPEQAAGAVNPLDGRADVYALGGILYFLLAGRAPLGDYQNRPLPPRHFDRAIPRALEAVCLKALAADRAARYSDVPDLAADLADFLARRRVRAYPEGVVGAAVRLATTYRTVLTLLLAYLLMRVLLLLFFRS
jgi:serine/threonine protein kinase